MGVPVSMRARAWLLGAVALAAMACERSPAPFRGSVSATDTSSAAAPQRAATFVGRFAYVDSTGVQLLALGPLVDPSNILGAVCVEGRVLSVRYDRRQTRQQKDDGRHVASNFSNLEGDVFRLTGGTARPDETCYLSPDPALLENAVAARPLGLPACSPTESAAVMRAKRRPVTHCWRLAETPTGVEVLAAQFVTIDSSALASLVLIRDGVLLFRDFPAVAHGADETLWRVDDQGVFSPEAFGIIFVAQLGRGIVMAITWAGAEGESDQLLRADSADALRALVEDYRYWAPN